jgi:hypothetical protein
MRADRRIDAAARAFRFAHRFVQRLAHAVQALELEAVPIWRHRQHGGDGVRVVRGELRVDAVGHRQQLSRAGDVRDVRVRLAGEHRIAGQAMRLGALDLGVPVGALDQPHHDAPVEPPGQRVEPVDDEGGARPIGLHDDAETVPAGEFRLGQHALDDVERQIQPVGLLSVDVQPHAGVARGQRQRQQPVDHHRQHGLLLRDLVARVQRRQFHRNAGVVADIRARRAAVQRGSASA